MLENILPHIKKWWLSFIFLFFGWLLTVQFWQALTYDIMAAVDNPHPFLFWPLYFVMDNLTLIIHEAGHTMFGLFGHRFTSILGGTLMQLLLPTAIFIAGWFYRNIYTAQLGLFWLAFSWFDTAAYCLDAKYRLLPLIGNLPKSAHDFYNILSSLGWMDHYRSIAMIMFVLGLLIMLLSLLWPLFVKKEAEYVNLDLDT